jgi:membrane fusion protein (multidrug efflux system)
MNLIPRNRVDPMRKNFFQFHFIQSSNLSSTILLPVVWGILLIFVSSIAGCSKKESSDSTPPVTVDVRAVPVKRGQVEETIQATGTTIIQRDVQLKSSINGILVDFKYFNGDKITKGTIIARIRSKEAQAALQGADVLMQSAQTEQQHEEARKARSLAEQSSSTLAVTAPFDGILANKQKNEMEVIAEGEQIASLVDPTSVVFAADVPSTSLTLIRTGQQAHLRFSGARPMLLEGIVNRIEPLMNPNDQTGRVKIIFAPNNEVLRGSLFGEVSIVTGAKKEALLVPRTALLVDDENNSTSVMVAGSDSLAHRVDVHVTWKNDSFAAITASSISSGTNIIIEGNYGLPDSTKIRVRR